MSLNEFINLITISGVVDDSFGAREIGTIFNMSMLTQVDEIHKERHCRMQFVEFLEAFTRVAERAINSESLLPSNRAPSTFSEMAVSERY